MISILRGISGAGKSTWAEAARRENGALVLSADKFFVGQDGVYRFDASLLAEAHGQCLRQYIESMGRPHIIVDNTNLTIAEVAPYIAAALAYRRQVEVLDFHVDVALAIERNVHGVGRAALVRMQANFDASRNDWPRWWPRPSP